MYEEVKNCEEELVETDICSSCYRRFGGNIKIVTCRCNKRQMCEECADMITLNHPKCSSCESSAGVTLCQQREPLSVSAIYEINEQNPETGIVEFKIGMSYNDQTGSKIYVLRPTFLLQFTSFL
jgi:hypothetical protein